MADLSSELQQAVALHQQGRLDEAEPLYKKAIAAAPRDFDAAHLLGMLQLQRGRYAEAGECLGRAVALDAHNAFAFFHLGCAQQELRRFAEAVASYDRAVALKPDFAEAFNNRANAVRELGRRDEALASFDRAVALKPDFLLAFYNRGNLLRDLGRHAEALASYDRALALKPDFVEALFARGVVLDAVKRTDDALATYDRALKLKPDHVEALNRRGNALSELGRYAEAIAAYDRVLAINPDLPEVLNNRGNALRNMERCADALASYEAALRLKPDYAEAHAGAGWTKLLLGDFASGWAEFEWRWTTEQMAAQLRHFPQPLWRGAEPLAGKTILLHAEQAYGDTIQFCRYASLVAKHGARVILEVQPGLQSLLARLDGVAQVVTRGEALPPFDCHCPLLSLPLALGTRLDSIPAAVPYLVPDTELSARWREELGPKQRTRVGLVWSSSNLARRDLAKRSIALDALAPLRSDRVELVSLQKEIDASDKPTLSDWRDLRHFGGELRDFGDTAALIAELDLVISIDTAVAHLAGAMGKPVWIMLPVAPDWRWLLGREDSPWYPSARLFRQATRGDWNGVIARVARALAALTT